MPCIVQYNRERRAKDPDRFKKLGQIKSSRHSRDGRLSYWQGCARARKAGATEFLTLDEHRALLASPRCHWCGCTLHESFRNIDHIVPLTDGGQHVLVNLVAACANCNMQREWQRKAKYRLPGES